MQGYGEVKCQRLTVFCFGFFTVWRRTTPNSEHGRLKDVIVTPFKWRASPVQHYGLPALQGAQLNQS